MRGIGFVIAGCLTIGAFAAAGAEASETREQYLDRLRSICEVGCLQPRQLQRTARKRSARDDSDMALIMDVEYVRRAGDKFELHNVNLETSYFEDLITFDAAGIDTSQRTGVGGLSRGERLAPNPNVLVIEMDEQTVLDLLKVPQANVADSSGPASARESGDDIVVDADTLQELRYAPLAELRNLLNNRRIVARGQPRFEVLFVGARRDFRRKQVILQLDDADNIVMLPRYDEDGEPILEGDFAGFGGGEPAGD